MAAHSVLRQMRRFYWGYLFMAPWVVLFLAFGIYPLFLSFYLTFFNYNFINPADQAFVGLGNWVAGFGDPLFWHSIFNIIYNQVIFIALTLIIGLGIALLLQEVTHFGRVLRTIYFLPPVLSILV